MNFDLHNPEDINSLEDYSVFLGIGLLNLKTLENTHIKAIEKGILDDTEEQYVLNLIQNLRTVFLLYKETLEMIFERMPENYNFQELAQHLLKKKMVTHEEESS